MRVRGWPRRATVAGVVASVMLGSLPARAAPIDPATPPDASGPVAMRSVHCDRRVHRDTAGRPVATTHVCVFWFEFDALAEADLTADHGAFWIQGTLTPARGWCARRLALTLRDHTGVVGDRAPTASRRVPRTSERTVALDLDADGWSLADGRLQRRFTHRAGVYRTSLTDGGSRFATSWEGISRGTASVAGAFELAVSPFGGPGTIRYGSRATMVTC